MGISLRRVWKLLVASGALAIMLVVIPAIGQEGSSGDEVLRLHLDDDGKYFEYVPASGQPVRENLPSLQGCRFREFATDSIARLDAGNDRVGTHGVNVGVWSGGPQGVPCSRIDGPEALTLTLGEGLFSDKAELDLEFKGTVDAQIRLLLHDAEVATFEVTAGQNSSGADSVTLTPGQPAGSCRGDTDSGPDSHSSDNCRVIVEPDGLFNAVELSVSQGEMSLAGGGDFEPHDHETDDTIFHLVSFEGLMDCGDEDTESGAGVEGTITRHANDDGSPCVAKPYRSFIDSEDNGLVFEISDPASQEAVYEAELTFQEELDTPPFELTLEYDPAPPYGDVAEGDGGNDNGFKEAPACAAYPFEVDENGNDVVDEDGAKTLVDGSIPDGHEACVISVSHNWDGTTFWHAVFEGDWKFR